MAADGDAGDGLRNRAGAGGDQGVPRRGGAAADVARPAAAIAQHPDDAASLMTTLAMHMLLGAAATMVMTGIFKLVFFDGVYLVIGFFLWLCLCDASYTSLSVVVLGRGSYRQLAQYIWKNWRHVVVPMLIIVVAVDMWEALSITPAALMEPAYRTTSARWAAVVRLAFFQSSQALVTMYFSFKHQRPNVPFPWSRQQLHHSGPLQENDVVPRLNYQEAPCKVSWLWYLASAMFTFQGVIFYFGMFLYITLDASAMIVMLVLLAGAIGIAIRDAIQRPHLSHDMGYKLFLMHLASFVPYVATVALLAERQIGAAVSGFFAVFVCTMVLMRGFVLLGHHACSRAYPFGHTPDALILLQLTEHTMCVNMVRRVTNSDQFVVGLLLMCLVRFFTNMQLGFVWRWWNGCTSTGLTFVQDLRQVYILMTQELWAQTMAAVVVLAGLMCDYFVKGIGCSFLCPVGLAGYATSCNYILVLLLALWITWLLSLMAIQAVISLRGDRASVNSVNIIQEASRYIRKSTVLLCSVFIHNFVWVYYVVFLTYFVKGKGLNVGACSALDTSCPWNLAGLTPLDG